MELDIYDLRIIKLALENYYFDFANEPNHQKVVGEVENKVANLIAVSEKK
jgi:hypothetical protein